jgi:hypothetical protein
MEWTRAALREGRTAGVVFKVGFILSWMPETTLIFSLLFPEMEKRSRCSVPGIVGLYSIGGSDRWCTVSTMHDSFVKGV